MIRAARSTDPAAEDARIEPDGSVPRVWLIDPEFDDAAERLRRLEGDVALLQRLQQGGFSDELWEPVAQELARYGLAVLQAWIRTRVIYDRVKQRTKYGLPTLEGWPDTETAMDIATMTVVHALDYFRHKVLAAGKWDPRRGASLRTYFIGQCLFKFANPYQSAFNAEIQRRDRELLTDDDDLFAGAYRGPEEQLVHRSELEQALAKMADTKAKSAFWLHSQGYTHAEIAGRLNFESEKQVDNVLTYQRRRMRRAS